MPLAHPLTGVAVLDLPPLLTAAVAVMTLYAVVTLTPARAAASASGVASTTGMPNPASAPSHPNRLLAALGVVGRVAGVAVLALVITGAFVSSDVEPSNVAPVLGIYVAWPLFFVVAALTAGHGWRAVDPFATLGAAGERAAGGTAPPDRPQTDVMPAVLVALCWVLFLSWYASGVPPRRLGLLLAVYTIVTVAACISVGRRRWLAEGEMFGLVYGWTGLLTRGRLTRWAPPAGAGVVLGVLLGGLLMARWRLTSGYGSLILGDRAGELLLLLTATAAVAGAALVAGFDRLSTRAGAPGAVVAAFVPVVAAVAVAVFLQGTLVAVQLLPQLALDPFGLGWDPLGLVGNRIDGNPFGTAVRQLFQLVILALGHLAGAIVLGRRVPVPRARSAGAVALSVSLAVGVVVLLKL